MTGGLTRIDRVDPGLELHPILAARYSPRAWSPEPVDADDLAQALTAARWAPSWGNAQLSRFVACVAPSDAFERLAATLTESNQGWARNAPVLLLTVATPNSDGEVGRHAAYDLGQAVAHLTFQAAALGLAVHQMAGFSVERAREAMDVPPECEPYTVVAVGRAGDPATLDERRREREVRPKTRRALGEVAFDGAWGTPFGARS